MKNISIILIGLIATIIGFIGGICFNSFKQETPIKQQKQSLLTTTQYLSDIDVAPDKFLSDFTEIHDIVKKNYPFFEHKNINPDSLYQTYSERIKNISTKEEYKQIVIEYFSALKNMHTNVRFSGYYLWDGSSSSYIENRIFVDYAEKLLIDNEISDKDEILEINHIPITEWITQQEKFASASTDKNRRNIAARSVFWSYFDRERTFLFKTKKGNKEVTLPFENRNGVEVSILQDSIGYVAINSMYNNVSSAFIEVFEIVKEKPVLIIDIRKNGGGQYEQVTDIAKYLIKTAVKSNYNVPTLARSFSPNENSYKGKLIVLIGNNTMSAAEVFALDLKEYGNAILIGSSTGGDRGHNQQNFTTKNGRG